MNWCCVCEREVAAWLPHPHRAARSPFMATLEAVGSDLNIYQCPHCGCNDRDRHLWLYMTAAGLPQRLRGASLLHFAPEACLEPLLERCAPARYVRADLYPQRAHHERVNAEELHFADASFDLIVANHLLEHVQRPERALAEFRRCLKPGGLLIAQTPYAPRLRKTFEVDGAPTPEFAKLFYGQEDHVRLFGADIVDYFAAAGLEGSLLPHDVALPDKNAQAHGCNAREPFFAFSRP